MGENKIMKKYKGVVFFDYDGTTGSDFLYDKTLKFIPLKRTI